MAEKLYHLSDQLQSELAIARHYDVKLYDYLYRALTDIIAKNWLEREMESSQEKQGQEPEEEPPSVDEKPGKQSKSRNRKRQRKRKRNRKATKQEHEEWMVVKYQGPTLEIIYPDILVDPLALASKQLKMAPFLAEKTDFQGTSRTPNLALTFKATESESLSDYDPIVPFGDTVSALANAQLVHRADIQQETDFQGTSRTPNLALTFKATESKSLSDYDPIVPLGDTVSALSNAQLVHRADIQQETVIFETVKDIEELQSTSVVVKDSTLSSATVADSSVVSLTQCRDEARYQVVFKFEPPTVHNDTQVIRVLQYAEICWEFVEMECVEETLEECVEETLDIQAFPRPTYVDKLSTANVPEPPNVFEDTLEIRTKTCVEVGPESQQEIEHENQVAPAGGKKRKGPLRRLLGFFRRCLPRRRRPAQNTHV